MRKCWLVLLVIGACSFDRSGLGSHPGDDGGHVAPADASQQPGTPDASQPGTPDATVPVIDAAPLGPPDASIGVVCGNQTCAANNVCCVSFSGGGGGGAGTYACKDKCDGNQGTFACDGPEDCPGKECCFGRYGSSCASSCDFGSNVACRSDADCPNAGDQCCPTQYPNVELCGAICF